MQVLQVPFLQELGKSMPHWRAASRSDMLSAAVKRHPLGSIRTLNAPSAAGRLSLLTISSGKSWHERRDLLGFPAILPMRYSLHCRCISRLLMNKHVLSFHSFPLLPTA
jgi:hypothetical protein